MKKALLHFAVAVAAGVVVMLVPLVTLAQVRSEEGRNVFLGPAWLRQGLRGLEGSDSAGVRSESLDFAVISVSFVVAMVVYLLVRRRVPRRDFWWVRFPPY